MSKMKSQFFTGLVLVTLLLSGGVARVALPADVKDGTELLNTLDNSTDTNINLTGNINTRLMDTSDPNNHLPTGFTPVPIERVITITSSGTTTISYGTTTQKAEDDGVEYYFTIENNGGITFSKAANLSGGYSGTGLFYVTDGKLTFDNTANLHDNKSYGNGGAIFAESSSTLTFKDATFTSNYAEGIGGAIGSLEGTITMGDATFTSNYAEESGGAIGLSGGTITMGKATFTSNTAEGEGGAIYAESASTDPVILTFNDNATFTSNEAVGSGGAIGLLDGTITINGNATFTSNIAGEEGGALLLANGSTLLISGTSTFSKNSTTQYGGGAISATGGSLTFGGAFTAEGNTSYGDGGALNVINSATITFNGTATFEKNKAGYDPADQSTPVNGSGGAMYVTGGTIDFHDTATFGGDVTADGNIATDAGGALYIDSAEINFDKAVTFRYNSVSAGDGGAIYLYDGTIEFDANATFKNNTSTDGFRGGGAIYVTGDTATLLTFSGLTEFSDNIAKLDNEPDGGYGGAIYLDAAGNLSNDVWGLDAKGKIVFDKNTGVQGGAIYSDGSTMRFNEIELTNNKATFKNDPNDSDSNGGGGALYVESSSYIVFNGPTTVEKNEAIDGSGGAFFVKEDGTTFDVDNPEDFSIFFKGKTTIKDNKAPKGNGGAFFLNAASVSFDGTTEISGNTAVNGGAFWLQGSMASFDGTAVIDGNTATGKGSAFYVAGESIIRVGNNSTLEINDTNVNGIYLEDDSTLRLHTFVDSNVPRATSRLTIASDIVSDTPGNTEIIKSGAGSVYIDGDASKFVGNLTIEDGDFYIGKKGTFGDIDFTELTIKDEGQLVLEVGTQTESSSDARISVATLTLEDKGDGSRRIVAKALNDSLNQNDLYQFIRMYDDTDIKNYITDDLIGSYFDFLTFISDYDSNADGSVTLKVGLFYDSQNHDGNFYLPREIDEFTLNAQLNTSNPLTVSGQGTLKLKNNNTVSGLSDDKTGREPGTVELLNGHTLTVAGSNTTASFSGDITGTGKFIVDSGVTQTLLGENTYSGGTEINSGGTLKGNSESLRGDIKVDGDLTFEQQKPGKFEGKLSGNGILNITGATIKDGVQTDSVLSFTNDSGGFSGATNINSGWLRLSAQGNLSGSDISVFKDGGLGGTGTVNNVTVKKDGVVQAFEGKLQVNGNLEYETGGILYVLVNTDANGNAINVIEVAGTATVDGATVKIVGVESSYTSGTNYTFLTADEIVGTFSNTTGQDPSGNWDFTFNKSSDGKSFNTVGTKSGGTINPPLIKTPTGLVWNQAEVARTLNTVDKSGGGSIGFRDFISELNKYTGTDANNNPTYTTEYLDITKQLSGSVRLNGLQLSLYSPYRTVFNRLTLGSELYSGSPIIYNNGSGGYAPISGLEHRGAGAGATTYRGQYEPINSHLMDEAATCQVPYFMGENNFWADVTHLQTQVKSDGNSDGYGISRTGLLIGMDIQRKPNSRVGVLFGYFAPYLWQNSDRVEADDYHAALYFQKNYYGTDLYGFLGYAHQEYNSQRFLDLTKVGYGLEKYSGKTAGDNFSMSLELSKPRYYGNNYILRPLIGLDYIFAAQNGYLDYGTNSNLFGLRYDRAEYDQWFVRIGLNLKRETFRTAMNFRAQYINQFGNHPYPNAGGQLISAYSTPNTNMNIRGVNLGKDYANVGFGLNWFVNESRSRFISFDYDLNVSKRITSHGLSLLFIEHF